MSLWAEKLYPYVFGLAAGVAWWVCDIQLPSAQGAASNVLSSALTLGAILTGFLATSKTILIGLKDSATMRQIRNSSYIRDLVSYLAEAIWLCFLFSLVTIFGFFLTSTNSYLFGSIWITVGAMAGFAFIRVTRIIFMILQSDPAASEDPGH